MNNDRYNFTAASTKLSESTSLKTRVSLVSMHSASVRKRDVALWGIQWMRVAEFVGVTEQKSNIIHQYTKHKKYLKKRKISVTHGSRLKKVKKGTLKTRRKNKQQQWTE